MTTNGTGRIANWVAVLIASIALVITMVQMYGRDKVTIAERVTRTEVREDLSDIKSSIRQMRSELMSRIDKLDDKLDAHMVNMGAKESKK